MFFSAHKWARRAVGISGIVVATVGALHGLIYGATKLASGAVGADKFPREMIWAYTGVNTDDGSFNQGQLTKSLTIIGVSVALGIFLRKISKWV